MCTTELVAPDSHAITLTGKTMIPGQVASFEWLSNTILLIRRKDKVQPLVQFHQPSTNIYNFCPQRYSKISTIRYSLFKYTHQSFIHFNQAKILEPAKNNLTNMIKGKIWVWKKTWFWSALVFISVSKEPYLSNLTY